MEQGYGFLSNIFQKKTFFKTHIRDLHDRLLWWTIVVLLLLRNLDFKTLYLHKCEIKSVRKVALGVLWACPLCKKGQNCCYATVYQHKHRVFFFHTTPWKYLDCKILYHSIQYQWENMLLNVSKKFAIFSRF